MKLISFCLRVRKQLLLKFCQRQLEWVHYGVGIIVSSQSPGDIDRRITKITNTRFIFAIEPSELNSVGGLLGDTPIDLMNNIPRLRVGTCLLAGSRETVKHSMVIQIEKRTTKDSGTTPAMIT
jgi:DNA helicase HerA-like ATPase